MEHLATIVLKDATEIQFIVFISKAKLEKIYLRYVCYQNVLWFLHNAILFLSFPGCNLKPPSNSKICLAYCYFSWTSELHCAETDTQSVMWELEAYSVHTLRIDLWFPTFLDFDLLQKAVCSRLTFQIYMSC